MTLAYAIGLVFMDDSFPGFAGRAGARTAAVLAFCRMQGYPCEVQERDV